MSKKVNQRRVKVLYQNLNGIWYAFANIDDNVYVGQVPLKTSAPSKAKQKSAKPKKARQAIRRLAAKAA